MYQIDILIQGYPGRAVCHGGLGWSTSTLLGPDRDLVMKLVADGGPGHLGDRRAAASAVLERNIAD